MIEFKNVYKTYPNGFTALKNINLKIEQGEFVAIIGLSGAGKSTILRCINRMHDVTKGELTVDGVDVNTLRGRELRRYRRKVGMIFQSFNLVSRSTAIKKRADRGRSRYAVFQSALRHLLQSAENARARKPGQGRHFG